MSRYILTILGNGGGGGIILFIFHYSLFHIHFYKCADRNTVTAFIFSFGHFPARPRIYAVRVYFLVWLLFPAEFLGVIFKYAALFEK